VFRLQKELINLRNQSNSQINNCLFIHEDILAKHSQLLNKYSGGKK